LRKIHDILGEFPVQWAVCFCLGLAIAILLRARHRRGGMRFWDSTNPDVWLSGLLLLSVLAWVSRHSESIQFMPLFTLLTGIILGQLFGFLSGRSPRIKTIWIHICMLAYLALVVAASTENNDLNITQYREKTRWIGAWNDPDRYGLLVGAGMILCFGIIFSRFNFDAVGKVPPVNTKSAMADLAMPVLGVSTAVFLTLCLLKSYSRGAWVGTSCAAAYLGFQFTKSPRARRSEFAQWVKGNSLSIGTSILFAVVLAVSCFHDTNQLIARRAFSVVNPNDFSWRNRVVAWKGGLQLMADYPLLGAGWNRCRTMYDNFYRPSEVGEPGAIDLNDYVMLGATIGIPSLICFIFYGGLCLADKSRQDGERLDEGVRADFRSWWLRTVCSATALVLFVGFWFDGGLFRFATAGPFWIFLELGRRNGQGCSIVTNHVENDTSVRG
jgi:hypothetical protein